jgi:hypothetical protein
MAVARKDDNSSFVAPSRHNACHLGFNKKVEAAVAESVAPKMLLKKIRTLPSTKSSARRGDSTESSNGYDDAGKTDLLLTSRLGLGGGHHEASTIRAFMVSDARVLLNLWDKAEVQTADV